MRLYQKDPKAEAEKERRREEAPPPEVKPLTMWNLISIGFRRYYDDLGKMVLTNILWALVVIVLWLMPTFILMLAEPGLGIILGILLLLLVVGPATAALYSICMETLLYQDPPAKSLFRRIRQQYRSAVVLTGLMLFFIGACQINIQIIVQKMWPVQPTMVTILFVAFFWCVVFFGMFNLYPFAFLVHQKCGAWTAIRRGMLVALARPFVSVVLLILELIILLPAFFTQGIFLFIFIATLLAFLGCTAVATMLEDYKE